MNTKSIMMTRLDLVGPTFHLFRKMLQESTFLGCTNATGCHKLKPLVIGKVKKNLNVLTIYLIQLFTRITQMYKWRKTFLKTGFS